MPKTLLQAIPERACKLYIAMQLARLDAHIDGLSGEFQVTHSALIAMTGLAGVHVVSSRRDLERFGLIEQTRRGWWKLTTLRWREPIARSIYRQGASHQLLDEFESPVPANLVPNNLSNAIASQPGYLTPQRALTREEFKQKATARPASEITSRTAPQHATLESPSGGRLVRARRGLSLGAGAASGLGRSPATGKPRQSQPRQSQPGQTGQSQRASASPAAFGTPSGSLGDFTAPGSLRSPSGSEISPRARDDRGRPTAAKRERDEQTMSRAEQVVFLERARRHVGIQLSSQGEYGRKATTRLRRRLREGYTESQLMAVCAFARTQWDAGEHFAGYKNLLYLWGGQFPAVLAAATAAGDTPNHLVYRTGEAKREWDDAAERIDQQAQAEVAALTAKLRAQRRA